jgi:predicted DNA binding CopG/RHH family protein
MAANPLIAFRVSPETKARLHALAQSRNVTDSALLQKLVEMALLQHVGVTQSEIAGRVQQVHRDARLYVRLRSEDHLLLRERANGRGLAAATYASMLLRAHLRAMSPLPDRELTESSRARISDI